VLENKEASWQGTGDVLRKTTVPFHPAEEIAMKLCHKRLADVAGLFQHFFPPKYLRELEAGVEARRYLRKVRPTQLVRALLLAYVWRMAGLEVIAKACGRSVKTRHKSTLSYCLRRESVLRVAQAMLEKLSGFFVPRQGSIIVLDSMAVTLPCSQRSNAKKFNNATVGGGVLWQFLINAPPNTSPVRILKFMHGAWNDSFQIRDCRLCPNGPIYLMDRGFYALDNIAAWTEQNVFFVLRAKQQQCHYEPIKVLDRARRVNADLTILWDGIAAVGKDPKKRVVVRLVVAQKDGKDLILVSNLLHHTGEQILQLYKKRWAIEDFHRLLKHSIGLAHLYSFQQHAMQLLVNVAFLLAVLLYLKAPCKHAPPDIVELLLSLINQIRQELNITQWKPNITTHKWKKKRRPNH
jgi:hypothetical protein